MFPIKDTIPSREPPIVTKLLIAVNTIIFLFQAILPQKTLAGFIYDFALIPVQLSGNHMTLITSTFLHGSWLHLLGNMWSLWLYGDNVEDAMGHFKFLVFYLLCGALSGYTHYLFNMQSKLPTIGASGAVAGVMGAYFLLYPHAKIITFVPTIFFFPLFIPIPAVIFLLFWFLSQVFSGTVNWFIGNMAGGVAWWGHIGGFISGMLLQKVFTDRRYRRPKPRYPDWVKGRNRY